MCQIPEDVLAWRRRDPGLAREWRSALRHTMGRAITAGYAATSMTRDGWYLVERVED
jgi:predicted GNAT superfamily acetyltransferase